MTDARFPERWLNDRRVLQLSPGTFRTFVLSLAWSAANRTDGVITTEDLTLMPWMDSPSVAELVKSGLWECHPAHWLISVYDSTQTTAAELAAAETARMKARDKKRRQRAAKASVPRDVPGDITRTGQDRTGQARTKGTPYGQGEETDEQRSA